MKNIKLMKKVPKGLLPFMGLGVVGLFFSLRGRTKTSTSFVQMLRGWLIMLGMSDRSLF